MSDQYHGQIRVPDDAIKDWRAIAAQQMPAFVADVRARFGEPEHAPDMPPLTDALQGFIKQPCRVLFTWIPDWAPNIDAGHYVVRFDTMTRSKAKHADE